MTSKFFSLFSLLLAVAVLSACASGGAKPTTTATKTSTMNPALKTAAIDRTLEKALADAEASGNNQEILSILERVYVRNPKDPIVATRYARSLRNDDQVNASMRILQPFSTGANKNVEAITEMAMTQLSLGDFASAEKFAEDAITMNPKNARAFLALGTAQDAQNKHQEAEVSFRSGMKYWQGDASPIMNNLALNLASQGHLEESLSLIEKAQALSPGRMDLERNRRIIATLLETSGPRPPAPEAKPAAAPKPKPKMDKQSSVSPPAAKPAPKQAAVSAPAGRGDAKVLDLAPKPQPAKAETKKAVEKKIEKAAEEEKMQVNVDAVINTKTNIKLRPLN